MKARKTGMRHTNLGVALLLFMAFFLGLSMVVYQDSYQKMLEEQRKSIYGAWHIAVYDTDAEVCQFIGENATIDKVGCMNIVGNVKDMETALVGCADDTLLDIGNIELLSGNLPKEENEIAIEASYLEQMGYSYEVGQDITLTVLQEDEQGDCVEETYHFKLCGVVKNYSAYWKGTEKGIASFLISSAFGDGQENTTLHVFAKMQDEFAEEANSISVLCRNKGYFLINDFTYSQYSQQDTQDFDNMFYQMIVALVGFLFVIILINADIRTKSNSYVIIRILGGTKGQVIKIYLREKYKIIAVSSIIGTICGIAMPSVFVVTLGEALGGVGVLCFNITHILRILFLLYFGLFLSMGINFIALFLIPLRGMPEQQTVAPKMQKRKKRLSPYNLSAILRIADRKQNIVLNVFIMIATTSIFVLAYQCWESYQSYQQYFRDYPADYTYGMLTNNYPPINTMSEEVAEQIQYAYGVGAVQTWAISHYYGLSFSGCYDEEYAEEIYHYLSKSMTDLPDTNICGALIGVSNNLLSVYTQEIDEGKIEEGVADDEVILYLPKYCKEENGRLSIPKDWDVWVPKDRILSEKTIAVGDCVQVNIDGTSYNLRIAGIIRSFEEETPFAYDPMRPYSLICNQTTYRRLLGGCEIAYAMVYGNDCEIPYQTDVELSKIKTSLFFQNNRVEREEQVSNLIFQVALKIILCSLVVTVTMVMHSGVYAIFEKSKKMRYQMLSRLGMPLNTMLMDLVKVAIRKSIIACTSAAFILLLIRFVNCWRDLLLCEEYSSTNRWGILPEVFTGGLKYTEWNFIGVLLIGMLFLNFGMEFLCDYRNMYQGKSLEKSA